MNYRDNNWISEKKTKDAFQESKGKSYKYKKLIRLKINQPKTDKQIQIDATKIKDKKTKDYSKKQQKPARGTIQIRETTFIPKLVLERPNIVPIEELKQISTNTLDLRVRKTRPIIPQLILDKPEPIERLDALDVTFFLKHHGIPISIPYIVLEEAVIVEPVILSNIDIEIIKLDKLKDYDIGLSKTSYRHESVSSSFKEGMESNKSKEELVAPETWSKSRAQLAPTSIDINVEEISVVDTLLSAGNLLVKDEDEKELSLGSLMAYDKPVIVLAKRPNIPEYEYDELLIRILREIFHMSSQGLPRPFIVSSSESLEERSHEFYVTDTIGLVSIRRGEIKEGSIRSIREKIRELFSQGYGFLVFYDYSPLHILERTLNIAKYVDDPSHKGGVIDGGPPAPVIEVHINENIQYKSIITYINKIWGRILRAKTPWSPYDRYTKKFSINNYARHADTMYYINLARIASSSVVQLEVPANKNRESLVHYAIKAIVYMYLKYVEGRDDVKAEHIMGHKDVIVVDVYSNGIIAEVETLYGRGLPLLRLRGLIEERSPLLRSNELWIILPPPQAAILPRHWIKALISWIRKRTGEKNKIKLFTIDIDEALKLIKNVEKGEYDIYARPLVRII